MHEVINQLTQRFPRLRFTDGEQFCWSPESGEIIYNSTVRDDRAIWSLLHETGHALMGHQTYQADVELLRLEVEAWQRACDLATELEQKIDEDHIQDCLDTYRDWLHKRSICPSCNTKALQQSDFVHYRCFNCHTIWKVSTNRFCRAYRRQKDMAMPALDISL